MSRGIVAHYDPGALVLSNTPVLCCTGEIETEMLERLLQSHGLDEARSRRLSVLFDPDRTGISRMHTAHDFVYAFEAGKCAKELIASNRAGHA
jgi:hypothetical protein